MHAEIELITFGIFFESILIVGTTSLQLDPYFFRRLYFIKPINKDRVLKQQYLMNDTALISKNWKPCDENGHKKIASTIYGLLLTWEEFLIQALRPL